MKIYDPDIRELLFNKLTNLKEFNSDPSTIVVEELDVCRGIARVDVAVVNGKLHGFEIKSEQDTLNRLASQAELYNKVFDKMTLVVTEKHYEKSRALIPEWWGIMILDERVRKPRLVYKRKPKMNKSINMLSLTEFLWKPELERILREHNYTKGVKSKNRDQLGEIITKTLNLETLQMVLKQQFKCREDWKALPLSQLYGD